MKVALNTYSIRREWDKLGNQEQRLDAIVAMCNDMNVHLIEFLDKHFERDQLDAHCKTLEKNGISVFAIGPHVKLLERDNKVDEMISSGKTWLELAHSAGIKMVRFQVGNGPLLRAFMPMDDFDEDEWEEYNSQMKAAVDQSAKIVTPLLEVAESLDTSICIETHHSYSSNWVYMKFFEERFTSRNLGWIFDIGNFENDDMRWKALDVIKENTKYIHAKAYSFNDTGMETKLDYPKAAKILHEAGFDGNWSVEFEGKMNGILGAFKTVELCKHSIAVATGGSHDMRLDFPPGRKLLKTYRQL